MEMSAINFAHDPPDWQIVDVLNGQGFGLGPEFPSDEQCFKKLNLDPSPFFDASPLLGQELANAMSGNSPASNSEPAPMDSSTLAGGHQFYDYGTAALEGPTTNQFNSACLPVPLGDIRSTSQLATERALYMNAPPHSSPSLDGTFSQPSFVRSYPLNRSPSLDYCSSPETSDTYNEGEDDPGTGSLNFYRLPDTFHPRMIPGVSREQPDQPHKWTTKADELTPLEMPDGSTRLTANWLPVDPQVGFTIAEPGVKTAGHERMPGDGNMFDMEIIPHAKDAFFTVESTMSTFGV